MKTYWTPTYTKGVGNSFLLWFENSNSYVVIDSFLNQLLHFFLLAKDKTDFLASTKSIKDILESQIETYYDEIYNFLEHCNTIQKEESPTNKYKTIEVDISHLYNINGVTFRINYGSPVIKSIIHPQLAYLSIASNLKAPQHTFDILLIDSHLCLFNNDEFINAYPKKDYHLLQGKLAMQLLCALYKNNEQNWLSTFHASTVTNRKEAIMLIGNSGKGKSTFTALLTLNGFNLVADDLTPLRDDKKIYSYPAAISIKEGAFNTIETYNPNFKTEEEYFFGPKKGQVKFLKPNNKQNFNKGYACTKIVCIDYNKNNKNSLSICNPEDALNILIPESWLSPDKNHAKQLLDWISQITFYNLSYSDTDFALKEFSSLFNS